MEPIADAERDRVIATLQRGYAAGRIDQITLNHRVEVALATQDAYQLRDLLADLPDLAGSTWTPAPNQAVQPFLGSPGPTPYQPTAPTPTWQQRLQDKWPLITGVLIALIFLWVFFAPGNLGSNYWMIWFFVFIVPMWRRKARKLQRPQPHQLKLPVQPPPPPRTTDRHAADGGPGQWNQPPGPGNA